MKKKHIIIISITAVMLFCILFRFFETRKSEKNQSEVIKNSMIASVEVQTPNEADSSDSISAPGRIQAIKSSDVICRAQGFILKQHYKEGDFVKEGQLLYTIDPATYKIMLDKAQAEYESAKANQYQAQKDYERAAELVKKDFVSKSHYDQALAAKDSANARVHSAIAAINDAKRLLGYTSVKAPISGKISQTIITVGNYLSSPNTVLTKIVSVDPIYVTYSLDSKLYSQMRNDEIVPNSNQKKPIKVEIVLPDGKTYDKQGVADFTDNTISETTGSITMRATFPNPNGALIPGDFVNVKVYSNKTEKCLTVPQSAVLQDETGRYLFIIDKDGVAHKRPIVTNGQIGDNWIVSSGIEKNEKFASSGVIKVRDNVKVKIITKEENKANKETPENNTEDKKTEDNTKEEAK